ncbi:MULTISPECIES: polyprenyl synthetase family protein [Micrococcaceae]|uniref:polyprenyl synthetase family protein n=1 Tax=Micrococcaceae TaxID=1268 RepID=UPI000CFBB9B9|nr:MULTISPECIES: polyprenyl synthetase family protein [unclassified Arthrobacter]PQZ89288.1 polyprenyl synthetase [Arthrobacter sp. MYb222]PRB78598.1 polyprenyl synthetase [Arthrobacter sp. MYb214]
MSMPDSVPDLNTEAQSLSRTYTSDVAQLLEEFLAAKSVEVGQITSSAVEIVNAITSLTRGGKRLRALFAFWGYLGAGGRPDERDIVQLGVALELFQGAALIHDDIIDNSDTRRGQPSVHKRFEAQHRELGLAGSATSYGMASAILTGDLCLSLSEEVFSGIASLNARARTIFNQMRTQVMAGQYLDVLEESAGPAYDPKEAVKRARTIVRFKSAKYSTENPFLLGGALAGASEALMERYSAFALPLGEAFQLRDDVLGVFGDPAVTGKPTGGDLQEGKRTELIAHALLLSTSDEQDFIQSRLGAVDLSEEEVLRLSGILRDSGALAATEQSISELTTQSDLALNALHVTPLALAGMQQLSDAVTKRSK